MDGKLRLSLEIDAIFKLCSAGHHFLNSSGELVAFLQQHGAGIGNLCTHPLGRRPIESFIEDHIKLVEVFQQRWRSLKYDFAGIFNLGQGMLKRLPIRLQFVFVCTLALSRKRLNSQGPRKL